jgi:hypothetical protein
MSPLGARRKQSISMSERDNGGTSFQLRGVRVTVIENKGQIGRERADDESLADNQGHVTYEHELDEYY